MISGVFFVIAACMCWGLVFVVPKFLSNYSPVAISMCRFLFFGIISLGILLINKRYLLRKAYTKAWIKVGWLAFFSTLVSYTATLFTIRYANSAVAALIFGMSPITISLYGNWIKKETPFYNFLFPLFLMTLGIVLVNFNAFEYGDVSPILYSFGLISGLVGLASWTWYTVANSHFMLQNKNISTVDLVVMTGTATLFLVILCCAITFCVHPESARKYFVLTKDLEQFLIGSFILGAVSSWLAFLFWMKGSLRLPISLAGQLTIFEMIFGILFVYLAEQRWPHSLEITGILIMIGGVLISFKSTGLVSKATSEN
jgi:drug/metabolite transporter (DMT)-like permease